MKTFIQDMTERAVKTAAQTALAALMPYLSIAEVNWLHYLGIVGMATLMSVLTSLASFKFGEAGTACVIKKENQHD